MTGQAFWGDDWQLDGGREQRDGKQGGQRGSLCRGAGGLQRAWKWIRIKMAEI